MNLKNLENKYIGDKVNNYDKRRRNTVQWKLEQKKIEKILEKIRNNKNGHLKVLDIPVGTGRFFKSYKKLGFKVTGVDISQDMIKQAEDRSKELNLNAKFEKGNIFSIPHENNSFDLSVCTRFMNHIDFDNFRKALKEIKRVSKSYIIIDLKIWKPYNIFTYLLKCYNKIREIINLEKNFDHLHRESQVKECFSDNSLSIQETKKLEYGNLSFDHFIFHLKKTKYNGR